MNFTTEMRSMTMAVSAVAMLAMGTAERAEAIGIDGSMPLAVLNATQNGANLSVSTLITGDDVFKNGAGLGDYAPIPNFHSFGTFSLDLTDLTTFSLTSATNFGSFAAAAVGSFIVSQSAAFIDLFLLGTYTPGPGLALGLDPTETSLRISINQSGDSISTAITLNTPPVRVPPPSVPAPASLALFGAALAGLAIARRRLS